MPIGAARVVLRTCAGDEHSALVTHPRGSLEAPMSDEDIAAKVRELAGRCLSRSRVDRLIEAVWRLDEAPDVRELMSLARPEGVAGLRGNP